MLSAKIIAITYMYMCADDNVICVYTYIYMHTDKIST